MITKIDYLKKAMTFVHKYNLLAVNKRGRLYFDNYGKLSDQFNLGNGQYIEVVPNGCGNLEDASQLDNSWRDLYVQIINNGQESGHILYDMNDVSPIEELTTDEYNTLKAYSDDLNQDLYARRKKYNRQYFSLKDLYLNSKYCVDNSFYEKNILKIRKIINKYLKYRNGVSNLKNATVKIKAIKPNFVEKDGHLAKIEFEIIFTDNSTQTGFISSMQNQADYPASIKFGQYYSIHDLDFMSVDYFTNRVNSLADLEDEELRNKFFESLKMQVNEDIN